MTNRKSYVECLEPGIFISETSVQEITGPRDQEFHARSLPASVYAFRYYDVLSADVDLGGELVTATRRVNESGWYYIDADVWRPETLRQVAEEGHRILLANAEANGWKHLVYCRTGNWQPYDSTKDQVVYTDE